MASGETKIENLESPQSYTDKSPIQSAAVVGGQGALVGTFISVLQNALSQHGQGATGFLTRYGNTIGLVCTF